MSSMPRFGVEPDRFKLGFEAAVKTYFSFLITQFGYEVVEASSTQIRYENGPLFVELFHGRGSYELGVNIGRKIAHPRDAEERFTLMDVIRAVDGKEPPWHYAATTAESVSRFVPELARLTAQFAGPALEGDDAFFADLRASWELHSQTMRESWEAGRLREIADEAWRTRDFKTVIDAYERIESDLPTQHLRPSEVGKLRYARTHAGSRFTG
jgi:hypothetical protein